MEGNAKVQLTVFTAGSSGNWNVSFFSIPLQLSLDLVGMEHGVDSLRVKSLTSINVDGGKFSFLVHLHSIRSLNVSSRLN